MEAGWCREVVEQAISRQGKPEIFNTDQGSQPLPLKGIYL
jgi:putative transposase